MRVRPDRSSFEALAASWPLVPVWTELLADVSTPVGVFPALAGEGYGILLESVERSERWGRYSFVAGDPAAVVVVDEEGLRVQDVVRELPASAPILGDARADLRALAESLRAPRLEGLPSLTGGLMGYLSYEAAGLLDETGRGVAFAVPARSSEGTRRARPMTHGPSGSDRGGV